MLGKRERSGLQHQDPMPAGTVGEEQALRDDAGKRAAAHDHDVERTRVRPRCGVRASPRLVQSVAGVATQDVARKTGVLRKRCRHVVPQGLAAGSKPKQHPGCRHAGQTARVADYLS